METLLTGIRRLTLMARIKSEQVRYRVRQRGFGLDKEVSYRCRRMSTSFRTTTVLGKDRFLQEQIISPFYDYVA
jgi:hypothetical protein